jgi:hypothetical protein
LVRVRAGDYEKGTVPPRLGTVTAAFECRLINMKILPTKIIRSTFSLITSRALSIANIVVIFEAIPANNLKNARRKVRRHRWSGRDGGGEVGVRRRRRRRWRR